MILTDPGKMESSGKHDNIQNPTKQLPTSTLRETTGKPAPFLLRVKLNLILVIRYTITTTFTILLYITIL